MGRGAGTITKTGTGACPKDTRNTRDKQMIAVGAKEKQLGTVFRAFLGNHTSCPGAARAGGRGLSCELRVATQDQLNLITICGKAIGSTSHTMK